MRAFLTLVLLATPALADDPVRGGVIFQTHCATCHGTDAMGGGPMAEVLHKRPSDLTQLSEDGGFPMTRVLLRIMGEDMAVHGGPMPLYGMILQGESEAVLLEDGGEMVVPEAVADVAAYIATLQQ